MKSILIAKNDTLGEKTLVFCFFTFSAVIRFKRDSYPVECAAVAPSNLNFNAVYIKIFFLQYS